MNSPFAMGAGCPFHQQLKEQAKSFDMFDAAYQQDPAGSLKLFREHLPMFYSEAMGYWIVTRYEDVKALFRDPILFSACNALEKLTPSSAEALAVLEKYQYGMDRTMVNEDEPVHMERRRALIDAFAPAKLEVHRDFVQQLVREKVDTFIHKGKADLVQEMLWEVPMTVALHFLGVPEDDMDALRSFATAHTVNTWGRPSKEEQVAVAEGVGQFWQYSGQVLEKMKNNPKGEGWMYDMIAKNRVMPEVVTDNYLHSMMMAIMVAAHETTALASANAFKLLLCEPSRWQKLCQHPELIPAAVEECLRHSGSVVSWRRQVTADTEFKGHQLKKGDKLFLVSSSANHDVDQFENADDFDLYRDNAVEHLTFGYGAHQCMGKNIGRMEMCIFIEELTRRAPDLSLCEQDFEYLPNTSFRGPKELWVEWTPKSTIEQGTTTFPIGAPDSKAISRDVVVKAIYALTDDIMGIDLYPVVGETLPAWSAGAHIELILGNGLQRKYSLCGPADAAYYRIAVKREDEGRGGSRWIHQQLKLNQTIAIKGPKNFFKLKSGAKQYVLIAAGIGITPILSMAHALEKAGSVYRVLYLGRERHDMALLDDALKLQHKTTCYVSSEGTRLDIDALFGTFDAGTHVYACGPERLLDHLTTAAADYPEIALTIEHFNAGSHSVLREDDEAFEVELVDSGLTLTVEKHQTLLSSLLEHGVDVSYDCCEGLCGSCQVDVVDGELDHRDVALSQSERQSGQLMMSCCSRGKGKLKLKL